MIMSTVLETCTLHVVSIKVYMYKLVHVEYPYFMFKFVYCMHVIMIIFTASLESALFILHFL